MANAAEVARAYVQIIPKMDGFKETLASQVEQSASASGSSSGSKWGTGFASGAKIATAAIAATSAAVVGISKSALEAGMTFDSSMSQVAATMGYTTEELADSTSAASQSLQELRDFAQQMGSATAFSASEAADALNYMALAGYDAKTSMEMLPTVLNLAAAGSIELAQASDMITDAQSALGLSIDETYAMVDKMAKASSKSNTSVAQLGEAFLTIGANAKQLNGGTTELATTLGLLADNGIKSAEGGTHLRNIMLALNPTTEKAQNAWKELGVSAYDADGNLRPLQDTFADLNKAMSNMNDQEKSNILTKMFNKTDLASVNALLATSQDRWTELTEEIENSTGAADAMANVQLDNLSGDITLFQSALEGAKIALSDSLAPTLREFVQFGSDGLAKLTEAFKSDGLTGAMNVMGEILNDMLTKLVNFLPRLVDMAGNILTTLIQGISKNISGIVNAAVMIVQTLGDFIIKNAPILLKAVIDLVSQLAIGLADAIPDLVPALVDGLIICAETLIDNYDILIDAVIKIILAIAEALPELAVKIVDAIPGLVMKIANKVAEIFPMVIDMYKQLFASLFSIFEGSGEAMGNFFNEVGAKVSEFFTVKIPEAINNMVQYFQELPEKIWYWLGFAIGKFGRFVYDLATVEVPRIATEVCDKVVTFFKELPEKIKTTFTILVNNVATLITDMKDKIVEGVPKLIEKFLKFFTELPDKFLEIGGYIVEGLWNGIKNAWTGFTSKVSNLFSSFVDGVRQGFKIESPSKVFAEIGMFLDLGLAKGIEDYAGRAINAADAMSGDVVDAMSGLKGDFSGDVIAQSRISADVTTESSHMNELIERINNIEESVYNAMNRAFSNGISVDWDDRNLGRLVKQYA